MGRRAKIVCTLGPASSGPDQVAALVAAGLDVARLNMSHGSQDSHHAAYGNVRAAGDASGRSVGVLVDLQGPKIRLGRFAAGPVTLAPGAEFTITGEDVPGDGNEVSTTYRELAGDVHPGTQILVDDGRVVLEVTAVQGARVRTKVVTGGQVSDHKGLNLPGVRVSVPALTSKDAADLRWALGLRADMIALSFVQGPEDAARARRIMDESGAALPLIAKIEKPQAVAALPEIIEAFDGIMVARGDLGVEFPLEQVPLVQKRAAGLARQAAKPVIVATQMLESMVGAPRPTRAEVSDVATPCSTARTRSCCRPRPASGPIRWTRWPPWRRSSWPPSVPGRSMPPRPPAGRAAPDARSRGPRRRWGPSWAPRRWWPSP
jgi:pyruvate kinase